MGAAGLAPLCKSSMQQTVPVPCNNKPGTRVRRHSQVGGITGQWQRLCYFSVVFLFLGRWRLDEEMCNMERKLMEIMKSKLEGWG